MSVFYRTDTHNIKYLVGLVLFDRSGTILCEGRELDKGGLELKIPEFPIHRPDQVALEARYILESKMLQSSGGDFKLNALSKGWVNSITPQDQKNRFSGKRSARVATAHKWAAVKVTDVRLCDAMPPQRGYAPVECTFEDLVMLAPKSKKHLYKTMADSFKQIIHDTIPTKEKWQHSRHDLFEAQN